MIDRYLGLSGCRIPSAGYVHAHVAQAGKPMLREAFVAETAVEALDVRVLNLLAGWIRRGSTPLRAAQSYIVLSANSGPLSVRITFGRSRLA